MKNSYNKRIMTMSMQILILITYFLQKVFIKKVRKKKILIKLSVDRDQMKKLKNKWSLLEQQNLSDLDYMITFSFKKNKKKD